MHGDVCAWSGNRHALIAAAALLASASGRDVIANRRFGSITVSGKRSDLLMSFCSMNTWNVPSQHSEGECDGHWIEMQQDSNAST
jgi:hypothetical protein